jgi:hypothetical protein
MPDQQLLGLYPEHFRKQFLGHLLAGNLDMVLT